MNTGAALALWAVLIVAYWVPAIVAKLRHVRNFGSITVINGLLGWTVIGWIVALAMACSSNLTLTDTDK